VHKHWLLLSSSVFTLSALSAAIAQAGEPTFKSKKVVVTATRIEEDLDETTRSINVVEKEQIEELQPQSVAELLSYQANVQLSGGPRADSQSVNIRGLTENRVLQLIDGVRQDFESGHRPTYFLDPELIKTVEVVKGPSSSLWGSGALGGVVAQETVSASDLLDEGQELGGLVKGSYRDNGEQWTGTAALAGQSNDWDWLLSGYHREGNDIELGNGDSLPGSSVQNTGALAKIGWTINDSHHLTANYRQSDNRGHVPLNGTAAVDTTSNQLIDRETDNQQLTLDYRFTPQNMNLQTDVKLYWSDVEIDEERLSDNRSDSTEQETVGLNINNLSTFGDITLLYGIDGYSEDFKADRGGDNRPAPPEATTDVWGAYIQANIPFAERWSTEIGVRYDDFSTDADNLNDDRSDDAVSPSLALSWATTDWLTLTLRYDEAFRAPSSEELYTTGTHFCIMPGFCNEFVSNPNLDPEKAENKEFIAKLAFNDVWSSNDELTIHTSYFVNNVDDFIEQVVTGPQFFPVRDPGNTTWRNVDEAELKGFEIETRYALQNFRASLSYGQTRGEDDETGRPLNDIPADQWSLDLAYAFLQQDLIAGVRVQVADDQDEVPDEAPVDEYDGYTITDLYVTWEPSQASLEGIKVDLSLNNITDKHYRIAFEELHQPGRDIRLAVRYLF